MAAAVCLLRAVAARVRAVNLAWLEERRLQAEPASWEDRCVVQPRRHLPRVRTVVIPCISKLLALIALCVGEPRLVSRERMMERFRLMGLVGWQLRGSRASMVGRRLRADRTVRQAARVSRERLVNGGPERKALYTARLAPVARLAWWPAMNIGDSAGRRRCRCRRRSC